MSKVDVVSYISFVLAVLVSCATEPAVDISGEWGFSETIQNGSGDIVCDGNGGVLLDLAGGSNRVSGQRAQTVTCMGGPTGFDEVVGGVHTITDGDLSGSDISFAANLCEYEGVVNDAADQMNGTLTCEFPIQGQPEAFTGTWTATR